MSISDRVRTLQAKGYLARATYNLLLVIADRVRSLDGYDEDTDTVIDTCEAALRHLNVAMTCLISNGEQRGTITDRDELTCALLGAYESIGVAFRKMKVAAHIPLETANVLVAGVCNLCDISMTQP